VLRSLLLWCASNQWLASHVPKWGFVRRATRRFLPGETFEAALGAAMGFKAQGVGAVFTQLGENIKVLNEALAVVEHYETVLAAAASAGVDFEISVKPTQLGLDIDAGATFANLERLARAASEVKSFLWVDMEGSAYTDSTLDLYGRLLGEHAHVGVCLQAYLYRTAADIARLVPRKPSIRLVKGAYAEPADRAFPAKSEVDSNYLALCALMLPEVKRHRLRLVMGTHDVPLITRVTRLSDALGVDRASMEVHMLYGIQSAQQVRLVGDGYRVKSLIAYGDAWYPWYLRRLAERPANVLFVARQLFG
jgi:proline dehydrogenase